MPSFEERMNIIKQVTKQNQEKKDADKDSIDKKIAFLLEAINNEKSDIIETSKLLNALCKSGIDLPMDNTYQEGFYQFGYPHNIFQDRYNYGTPKYTISSKEWHYSTYEQKSELHISFKNDGNKDDIDISFITRLKYIKIEKEKWGYTEYNQLYDFLKEFTKIKNAVNNFVEYIDPNKSENDRLFVNVKWKTDELGGRPYHRDEPIFIPEYVYADAEKSKDLQIQTYLEKYYKPVESFEYAEKENLSNDTNDSHDDYER